MNKTQTNLGRGLGALAFRAHGTGRPLHLVVADALRQHPTLSAVDVRSGWYAERAQAVSE